jgi:hypothetical protein
VPIQVRWQLGYTTGPVQKFQSNIMPGVIRLVRVDRAEPGAPQGDIPKLMSLQRP